MGGNGFDERVAKALCSIAKYLARETRDRYSHISGLLEEIIEENGVNPTELLGALAKLMDKVSSIEKISVSNAMGKHSIHEYTRSPKYILIKHNHYLYGEDNSIGLVELHGEPNRERSKLVVYSGDIFWDEIVIDKELSGSGVSIGSPRIVSGILNSPLVSLIIEGLIIARIREVSSLFTMINSLLSTSVNNLEATIALIKSTVIPGAVVNINPRRIEKDVLAKIIAYAEPARLNGWIFEEKTIFSVPVEGNITLSDIEVAGEATDYISRFYNGLKFAWVELSSTYIGKARITVPRSALINLLWPCRPGQVIIIDGEELACRPSPALLDKLLMYPRSSSADSMVFVKIEYVDSDEVIIERA